jgi:hypothetical protein
MSGRTRTLATAIAGAAMALLVTASPAAAQGYTVQYYHVDALGPSTC